MKKGSWQETWTSCRGNLHLKGASDVAEPSARNMYTDEKAKESDEEIVDNNVRTPTEHDPENDY